MRLDFDREVVAFSSQPFWLYWQVGTRWRRHAPDFFARLVDGGGVVVDVRADDRIPDKDARAFAVTARACEGVGWAFRRLGVVDPVLAANLLRLQHHRADTLVGLADYLHQRTAGMIGSLSHLIRGAALDAILSGTEKITKKLLDAVDLDHAAQNCGRRPNTAGQP